MNAENDQSSAEDWNCGGNAYRLLVRGFEGVSKAEIYL
jgi:hypothetical protein